MKLTRLLATPVFALLLLGTACSTTSPQKAARTATSLEMTARDVQSGHARIDAVLASLTSLVHSPAPDLKAQFLKFESDIKNLETYATDVGNRSTAMQKDGAAYFRTWDEELAKITNEAIRSRSTARKNAVTKNFEQVRISHTQAHAAFGPFMSDLKDIRTALAMDLTAPGLDSVKPAVSRVNANSTPLRASLHELENDFRTLGVSLTTATPAT